MLDRKNWTWKYGLSWALGYCIYRNGKTWLGATFPLGQVLSGGEGIKEMLIGMKTNPQAWALRWWWVTCVGDQNGILGFFSGVGRGKAWLSYSLTDRANEGWCVSIFMRDRKRNPCYWVCHTGEEIFFILGMDESSGNSISNAWHSYCGSSLYISISSPIRWDGTFVVVVVVILR